MTSYCLRATARALFLPTLLGAMCVSPAQAAHEIIVTTTPMTEALTLVTNPKAARQPLPAHDGADYLKTIPGFSVIRKGGTDGDPLFRGMAGSRLNILQDGQLVLGGCGNRMDPPTAYIYPETFDRLVVVKGPQSVRHGPGSSAATLRFERDPVHLHEAGMKGNASAVAGSFGRFDTMGDLTLGTPTVYTRLIGSDARSDDHEDGDGNAVHSAYERWSANAIVGWNIDQTTNLELGATGSDGEAAYADRAMDGSMFERENLGLKLQKRDLSPFVPKLEAQLFYNYVDHVMDNYSLRSFTPSMMMPNPAAMNPDRRTTGARFSVDLLLNPAWHGVAGLDYQSNEHSTRSSMNQTLMPYQNMARIDDAEFHDTGVFGELTWSIDERQRLIGGLRMDDWSARDKRQNVAVGMMMTVPNPTAGKERNDTLTSGFLRFEQDLANRPVTVYAGLGYVERFPDYWELVSKESLTSVSAFDTAEEKTSQLDVGLIYKREGLQFSLSAFHNDIDDYILIQSNVPKGMRFATVTRNIDAGSWGGEADIGWQPLEGLTLSGTLAYTHGENDSDDRPLAQMPPLEARFGVDYARGPWSVGALLRAVDDQGRVAIEQGNIVGQDLGETAGFGVVSLNAGWRARSGLQLTAGVDNLFDRTYAEHLSRSGAMVSGFTQTTRVNEPGQVLWLKLRAEMP